MPIPGDWDAEAPVDACPVVGWEVSVWRMRRRKYAAMDPAGSRIVSGRYNRGLDRFPEDQVFPTLCLSTIPEICLGEMYRRVTLELPPSLNDYRLSELTVRLQAVVDCRDSNLVGLSFEDLVHDTKQETTQGVGAAVFARGLERDPHGLGNNLIVLPARLGTGSRIAR